MNYHHHPDQWVLIPTIALVALRCENEDCGEFHGVAVQLTWMTWTIEFAFT